MATLGSPLHTFRCLLRELRALGGKSHYRQTAAYGYIRDGFKKNKMTQGVINTLRLIFYTTTSVGHKKTTSEKFCRAQQELHFQASTYLCLLRSVRNHVVLHEEYHGKGERSTEEVASLVGLKLPQQPGGKGWES